MQAFKNKVGVSIIHNLIKIVQENKDYLSEIDGKIGDGDHGINMNKGFTLCEQRLSDEDSMTTALEKLGNVLLEEVGGSMGPLYGMFFLSMKTASEGKEEIDAQVFKTMLHKAYNAITDLGNAKVGDKTLVDTLDPVIRAYDETISQNVSFVEALMSMDRAAEKGYKSTKGMIAKKGRSSRLGERSRDVLDAGATSCYLILHSMKESITTLIRKEEI